MNNAVGTAARDTASSFPPLPIIGVLIAIAATTTMDATGLSVFSAFALLPLMLLFWYLESLSRSEMGFKWGRPADFALALLYPVVVIGLIVIAATFAGAVDISKTNWQKALLNLVILTISTALVAIITEEGFFRGWLWGSLRRRRISEAQVLIYTSIAFSAWHISAVTLDTDYRPATSQILIFLINAAVIGIVWGSCGGHRAQSSSPVAVMVYGMESPMCFSVLGQKPVRSASATLQSSVPKSAFLD